MRGSMGHLECEWAGELSGRSAVEKYAGGGGPLVLVGAAGIIYYFVV